MRYLVLVAVLGVIGCRQPATTGDGQRMAGGDGSVGKVPVSGRGDDVQLSGGSQGAVRKPVAGGGQVVGGAVVWEYDAVPRLQLMGVVRSRRDGAAEEQLRGALNEWGAQGWELVMVSGETFIFKRPSGGF